jgi:hypothetical protein
MAKIPVSIGPRLFPTKDAAKEHYRAILYRHLIGRRIPEPDATELAWLLERHPEVDQKIGAGIDYLSVRDALYGKRCFEVVRIDGTSTDFSFGSCVDGRAPSPLTEALNALRAEVTEDILRSKREWFRKHGDDQGKVACAISGKRVTIEEAHADHAPPRLFGTLAIAFLTAHGIKPGPELITPPADNQYQPLLADRALAERWRQYHHELAVIRIVARGENLTRGHEGKVKKKDQQLRMK